MLDVIPGEVFTAGDNSNNSGTAAQYTNCFEPTWGRHKARIHPAAGNHDYGTNGGAPYFSYFGAAAHSPNGYYSYDLNGWHIIVLNSNCSKVGGCEAGSWQEKWLKNDLATHSNACSLAYYHHPRFSSGPGGNNDSMQAIWADLYDAGVELVLSGHDHSYERFMAMDAAGNADPVHGIRQIVVGTGGAGYQAIPGPYLPTSEVHAGNVYGVIKLTLRDDGYDWAFVPEAGKSFTDSGSGSCH